MTNRSDSSSEIRRKKVDSNAHYHLIMIRVHLASIERILATQNDRMDQWLIHSARLVCSDIRFVVEELMLLSVAANEQAGEQITKAIRKEYRAGIIVKKLKALNPNFFPGAISVVETDEVGIEGKFVARAGDHLTTDQAVDYWNKSGDILHAKPKAMSEGNVRKCLDHARNFFTATLSLLETFEVDVSGKGMWIGGHLNFNEVKGPVLLHSPKIEE
jgi:hypothetical protein